MIELTAIESTIENEIRQGATQKQVAQTYALGLGSTVAPDWRRINAAIVERWNFTGLTTIKRLAWGSGCWKK